VGSLLFDLLMWPIAWVFEKVFDVVLWRKGATTAADDPDYKTNVQRRIERNREFEKQE
jgi:hypothetical protein